jgi:phage gpG-like protein
MADAITVDTRELAGTIVRIKSDAMMGIRHAMPIIAESLVAAVSDVYEAEGPGWADLQDSTVKQRRGSSYKILQDTGVMAGSTSPGYGADWAEAFAGTSYADFHATGTRHMVKRNPFALGPFEADVLEEAADVVAQHVT